MKQMKVLVSLSLALMLVSGGAWAYTFVNRTVSVQNAWSSRMFNATLWAYTTARKGCYNMDGFDPFSARNITFFSTEENMTIRQAEFCHPELKNILVEFACPLSIRVNGASGTQFPRFPGLFLFDCGSIGMKCKENRCVHRK